MTRVADTPVAAEEPDVPAPHVVAFDIGEVLIDETRVWSVWADLIGTTPLTFAAALGAAIVQGEDHHAVFGHVAPNVTWTALTDEHERLLGGLQEIDLYADVRACLSTLRSAGYPVVLAGNQPSCRRAQLDALHLDVDDVVTSDDLGAEKPDPTFFRRLLEHLDLDDPAALLYVGDRVDNDMVPAHRMGLATCWVRRGPWGLLQDLPDDVEVDLVLEGLGELPELLTTWSRT